MADLARRTTDRATRWRPSWPAFPALFVREMLAGHSALGLALGGLLYLICVTGTLDVFVSNLRAWERPRPQVAVSASFIDNALSEAQRRTVKTGAVYLMLPPMEAGRARLEIVGGGKSAQYALGRDGRITGGLHTPFTDFVDQAHMYLCLPATAGLIVVGGLGAALMALLVSGVLAHPRILRDAFILRWGGSKRLQEADLHNRLSVWGLPFHVAVTLTGAFLGLSNLLLLALATAHGGDVARISALLNGPTAARDERPASMPPIAPMLRRLGVSKDLKRINYVGVQDGGTRGALISLEVAVPGRLVRGERQFFDGDGRYLGSAGYADGPAGKQAYAAAASLHYGAFGGTAVRLAYGALGFALCVICAGGVSIWTARRRDQGRPAPRVERLWLGVVWGVLTGLSLSALAALASPIAPLPIFCAVLVLSAGAAVALPGTRSASRLSRASLAASLAALAITHLVKFWGAIDPGCALVDGLCGFVAAGLGASMIRRSKATRVGVSRLA